MHSKWFSKVKNWFVKKLWTKDMVFSAVPKMITADEYEEIVGEEYVFPED